MTVLQFSSLVPPAGLGGAERVVTWLTQELETAGVRVRNAGLRGRADTAGTDAHPIRNIYWPFDGVARNVIQRSAWHAVDALLLTARRQVEKIFDEVDPSVVVTHNLRGWGFAPWVVAQDRGVPLIQVIHDYGLICNASTLWRGAPCQDLCASCALRRTSARRHWPGGQVVGVSQAVLDTSAAHGLTFAASGKVTYPLAAATQVSAGRMASLPENAPVTFGFLGRVTPSKGLAGLLGAMQGSEQRLLIGGSGETSYVGDLQQRSPANVSWLGWVEPEQLLRQIDVLVVPSAWPEPFGLVVVEAANAGVPVLIADHPGLVEAARASSATFATFAANDPDALPVALARPLSSYRTELAPTDPVDLVGLITATVWEQASARDRLPRPTMPD